MKHTMRSFLLIVVAITSLLHPGSAVGSAGQQSFAAKAATLSGPTGGSGQAPVSGSGTITPDLFTGTLSDSMPIDIPAGINGMQPSLALTYHSNGGNGWLGLGWDLELGSIERSTKNGLDYSADNYMLRMAGSTIDLVPISKDEYGVSIPANQYQYRAKIEGLFFKIIAYKDLSGVPQYWEVFDKSGSLYRYGYTSAERQYDPNNADHIFKWCLNYVQDTNNNFMKIAYTNNLNQIYPTMIVYTGNDVLGVAPLNSITFDYEARSDAPVMFTTNFNVATAWRLKALEIESGDWYGAYWLSYAQSASTGRSLLASVQRYGADYKITNGTISGTSMPTTTFGWQAGSSNWPMATTVTSNGPNPASPASNLCFMGDIDGNGKADVWCDTSLTSGIWMGTNGASGRSPQLTSPLSNECMAGDMNGDGKLDVWCQAANNTNGWYVDPWTWPINPGTGSPYVTTTSGLSTSQPIGNLCFTGDLDGDGKMDMWCETGSNTGLWNVALSTGGSWSLSSTPWVGLKVESPVYNKCFIGEMNGDGKIDMWCETGSGTGLWNVALSTGSSWSIPSTSPWSGPAVAFSASAPVQQECFSGDLNGDGKTDFWCQTWSGGSAQVPSVGALGTGKWNATLSTGSSWTTAQWSGPITIYPVSNQCFVGDLNADGKTDFWCAEVSGSQYWYTAISTGSSWTLGVGYGPTANYSLTDVNAGVGSLCYAGDFNGSGLSGFLCQASSGSQYWFSWEGTSVPDLLTTIASPLGSTTTISYAPSTQYSNIQLPFAVQVVSSISTNDGNGNIATTTYTYAGGYYHPGEKDFRGFNYVKSTGPTTYVESWFHQGNEVNLLPETISNADLLSFASVSVGYMKGKPYRTRVADLQGNIYTETTTSYLTDVDGAAPYFTPIVQVDTYNCDGKTTGSCATYGNSVHVQTMYTYETGNGNLLREDQYGNLNDPTDNSGRTIVNTYAINSATAWILDKPATESVYQGTYPNGAAPDQSKLMSLTTYYYDGPQNCSMPAAQQSQQPAVGKVTGIVKWLNPKQTGTADPELRMGYNAYGNLVCTRDENGNLSSFTYDKYQTFQKTATNALGQTVTTQYYGVDTTPVTGGFYGQVQSITDANLVATSTYWYDPLGRKTKMMLADGETTTWSYNNFGTIGAQNVQVTNAVGLTSQTYFDGFGRSTLAKQSGPSGKIIDVRTVYSANGTIASKTLPYFESDATYSVEYAYDAIGRVSSVTNPDSSVVRACYDRLVFVGIDADGHRKRQITNAQGKMVKVEEYTGTYSSCSADELSPYSITTYAYDVLGNLLTVTDQKGNQTRMSYDSLSRKTAMSDPDMGAWQYFYDANNNLIAQIDALQTSTTFSYDALNRVTLKSYPSGTTVSYRFDTAPDNTASTYPIGRLSIMSDATGTTKYFYDKLGRSYTTKKTISGVTFTTVSSYDLAGRLKSMQYPIDNEVVNYSYDAGGNLSVVSNSTATYVSYTGYNSLGQPGESRIGNNIKTAYTYKPANNRLWNVLTSRASGTQTYLNLTYDYYDGGNVKSITDGVNAVQTQAFAYDELNRLSQAQSTTYGDLFYSYDQIGNFAYKSNDTGGSIFVAASCPNGTTVNTTTHMCDSAPTCSIGSYDSNFHLCSQPTASNVTANCPAGTTLSGSVCTAMPTCPSGSSLYYSLSNQDQCKVSSTPTCTAGYSFYSVTHMCEKTSTGPTCSAGTGTYNSANGFCEYSPTICPSGSTLDSPSYCLIVADPDRYLNCPANTTYIDIDDLCEGWVDATCSSGTFNSSTRKCDSTPIGTTPSCSSGTFDSTTNQCIAYYNTAVCATGTTYDSKTYQCEATPACSSPSTFSSTAKACQVSATCPAGTSLNTTSNRCEAAAQCTTGSTFDTFQNKCEPWVNYTYSSRPHAVTATSDGMIYSYDANGNMISDGTRTITYDYDNRPISIIQGAAITRFLYDGSGNRVKKTGANGTTVYVGKLLECNPSSGTCVKYIFAGGTRIAQKVVGSTNSTVYYHQDHLGSTRAVTDANGNLIENIFYYPFGAAQADSGGTSMRHKYTSQEFDAETGLYYYNARYYNPSLGRFISADTVIPNPANPQALNRYSYVVNNPLRYIDPSGHDFWSNAGRAISRASRDISNELNRSAYARVAGWLLMPGETMYFDPRTRDAAVAGTEAYILSGGNPAAAAAAAFLDGTREGKHLTQRVAVEVFVKHLGMRPKEAYMVASLSLHMGMTYGLNAAGVPKGPGWEKILNGNGSANASSAAADNSPLKVGEFDMDKELQVMKDWNSSQTTMLAGGVSADETLPGMYTYTIDEPNPIEETLQYMQKAAVIELKIGAYAAGGVVEGGATAAKYYGYMTKLTDIITGGGTPSAE
jgi:RHS repeat-associated protein